MKKLRALRQHLLDSVPILAANPDKLLTFIDKGKINHVPRSQTLSFEYDCPVTIIVVEYSGSSDSIILPILAFLESYQADRPNNQALTFNVEVINNTDIDIEVMVNLTEAVRVTNNPDGTVSTQVLDEPIYNALSIQDTVNHPVNTDEWLNSPSLDDLNN